MQKRWTYKNHDYNLIKELSNSLNISPIVAAILTSRGYQTEADAKKFLNPKYTDLHEPNLLKGMEKAVKRILKAIENNEKILIWGDYDVDGTTGTTVLRKALEILGAKTGFHIPHRFTEGYGINIPMLKKAKERDYKLVISVDCGITSFEPVAWANENGLDFIITDHHLAKEKGIPDALAVINPNQEGCQYPDKHLAGVGVAFKLAQAILREKGKEKIVPHFLKVVAIGTVADVMKLTGENRAIVAIGLDDLPNTVNYGLKALMEVSDCRAEMTSYHIGYRIAPRINAAGRMDAARNVVELFEAENFETAKELAEYLNNKNIERQKVQLEITEKAFIESEHITDKNFVVVSGKNWHRGVIGLAASKIAEKLFRPTIVISIDDDGMGHGSARSISDYHLLKGLDSCSDLFEQYGGHAMAAGFKIKEENISELQIKLDQHATANLSAENLIPEIKIDANVSSQTLSLDLVEDIKQLEPFGQGNPKPVFVTKQLLISDEPWIMKDKHLKLKLADEDGKSFEAVWWDGVEKSVGKSIEVDEIIDVAYTPEINNWRGNTNLQLIIKDIKN